MSSSLGAISYSSIRQKPAQEKKIGHKISNAEQKIIILVIFRSNSNNASCNDGCLAIGEGTVRNQNNYNLFNASQKL